MIKNTLYTIGHSKHSIEYFIELLKKYSINCIIDVRSIPFSKIAPQYNKDVLAVILKDNEILYFHMQEEFGARKKEISLLDDEGKVDFSKVRETEKFKKGIERIKNGVYEKYNIALMCSEAEPFDCHRFVMISYQFVKEGINIKHILKDGMFVDNKILETRLLNKYSKLLPEITFFVQNVTDIERLEVAYKLRNKDIAFSAIETDSNL